MRYVVCWLARSLAPAEREAVLGDLAESHESGVRAMVDLAGLVARRQAALWKAWRPWAALCLAIPAGWYLGCSLWRVVTGEFSGLDLWLVLNRRDLDPAVLAEYGMSVRHAIIALVRGALMLTGSAWLIGLAVSWLAQRAVWVHAGLFAALVVFYPLPDVLQNGDFWTFLMLASMVLLPAALGIRLGRRPTAV